MADSAARGGEYFLQLLADTSKRLADLCVEYDPESIRAQAALSEEVDGKIRASIGKAQLLIRKRFPQFYELCHTNKDSAAALRARDSDLEGYWDVMAYAISDVEHMFEELSVLRARGWVHVESSVTAATLAPAQDATLITVSSCPSLSVPGAAPTDAAAAAAAGAARPKSATTSTTTKAKSSSAAPRAASAKLREAIAQRRAAMKTGDATGAAPTSDAAPASSGTVSKDSETT